MTRYAHKLHSHTGRLLPNLQENTARDTAQHGLWLLKLLQLRLCGTTLLTCPFSLCLVFYKGASNNRTIPLATCLLEVFNVLKCFGLFQGSLGWDAGHVSAWHHRVANLCPPWRQTKATWRWSWATGSGWSCLSRQIVADGLQRSLPTPTFCHCLFSLICIVHTGKVWQLPACPQGRKHEGT